MALSQIDLIIIEGFLKENAILFNQFCIEQCIGTEGTGPSVVRHIQETILDNEN